MHETLRNANSMLCYVWPKTSFDMIHVGRSCVSYILLDVACGQHVILFGYLAKPRFPQLVCKTLPSRDMCGSVCLGELLKFLREGGRASPRCCQNRHMVSTVQHACQGREPMHPDMGTGNIVACDVHG